MQRFLLIAVSTYGLIAAFAYVFADRLIFQPPPPSYSVGGSVFRRITMPSGDSLAVLHLPNPAARYTILYNHGNAEDLGHTLPFMRALHDLGFSVVGYDYRGYGHSSAGLPTVEKAVDDAEAVYRYVLDQLGVGPQRLILYGTSVGCGPALELAVRHEAAGLILQSPFTSAFRVVTRVRLLPFDRFPNLDRIRQIRSPLLVIHGTEDMVVPWSHGKRLFSEAPEPKRALWVEGAGHNNVVQIGADRYSEALVQFVDLLQDDETGNER